MEYHQPVLLQETIQALNISPGKTYLDGTLGHAGHTLEILRKGAQVFGLEADPTNLKIATQRVAEANLSQLFHPLQGNFSNLKDIFDQQIHQPLDGFLFDLGLSSTQQKSTDRGFSFNDPNSLDMRLNPETQPISAEEIINTADFDTLYEIFTKLGQEKYSKPIILRLIRQRQHEPIKNAQRLANIIRTYYQEHHIRTHHDPATQIFLALRIYVNSEFDNLKTILSLSSQILAPQGIGCIITFHSGEDRLVKVFLQQHQSQFNQLPPVRPSHQEIRANQLSRSATLRSFQYV